MLIKTKFNFQVLFNKIHALVYKKKTYCHLLWDSVYIDQLGNVYTCCHSLPSVIGNINDTRLGDIWKNSQHLIKYRRMSSLNCLPCFEKCNLIPISQKEKPINYPKFTEYPRRVWILYGEFCNIDCIMCWQEHKSKIFIDNEVLRTNIEWAQVQEIELQGGEILATNRGRQLYLWLTKEKNKKVNLITNGLLIDNEWAEYLVRGSSWVAISVNAASGPVHELVNKGSNFDEVCENIRKLVRCKKAIEADVSINFKFTIVQENILEIGGAIKLADELGCDKIEFGYDPKVIDLLKNNNFVKVNINNQLTDIKNDANINIYINYGRLEHLGLI